LEKGREEVSKFSYTKEALTFPFSAENRDLTLPKPLLEKGPLGEKSKKEERPKHRNDQKKKVGGQKSEGK